MVVGWFTGADIGLSAFVRGGSGRVEATGFASASCVLTGGVFTFADCSSVVGALMGGVFKVGASDGGTSIGNVLLMLLFLSMLPSPNNSQSALMSG